MFQTLPVLLTPEKERKNLFIYLFIFDQLALLFSRLVAYQLKATESIK